VTAFASGAGQTSISRFASATDQVGQRAIRFDGGGKARHDRMVELIERRLKLYVKNRTLTTDSYHA